MENDGSLLSDARLEGDATDGAPTGWTLAVSLAPPTGAVNHGEQVAMAPDGNFVLVGDSEGGGDNKGAVIGYGYYGSTWSSGLRFTRPMDANDFGDSVALSNGAGRIAIGDSNGGPMNNGAVTVYNYNAGTTRWDVMQTLTPPSNSEAFGISLSMSPNGNFLVVGDHMGGVGGLVSVYYYRPSTNRWDPPIVLTAPANPAQFGRVVDIDSSGTKIIVGDPEVGRVRIYTSREGSWDTGIDLTPGTTGTHFGCSVSISSNGTRALGGDFDGGDDRLGHAHFFRASDNVWTTGFALPRWPDSMGMGVRVALSGDGDDAVVIAANGGIGNVVAYNTSGNDWRIPMLLLSSTALGSKSGSVDISADGNRIAVGLPDARASQGGEVHIYNAR